MTKKYSSPQGVMTEEEWVGSHAGELEEYYPSPDDFFDRRKFNRLSGDEQVEYEKSLMKKAEKPLYFAYTPGRGANYRISRSTFEKYRHRIPVHSRTR